MSADPLLSEAFVLQAVASAAVRALSMMPTDGADLVPAARRRLADALDVAEGKGQAPAVADDDLPHVRSSTAVHECGHVAARLFHGEPGAAIIPATWRDGTPADVAWATSRAPIESPDGPPDFAAAVAGLGFEDCLRCAVGAAAGYAAEATWKGERPTLDGFAAAPGAGVDFENATRYAEAAQPAMPRAVSSAFLALAVATAGAIVARHWRFVRLGAAVLKRFGRLDAEVAAALWIRQFEPLPDDYGG